MEVQVGDKAPDFTLPSQMGDNVTLSEYLGKKNVVLYFYPKDETQGCTKEACAFRDSYQDFAELGAEVLGVSGQSVESHKSFATHHGLQFLLLADKDNVVRKLYGVPASLGVIPGRVSYVIDKKGVVRHIFNSQYQPEKHVREAKQVLEKLNEEEKTVPASNQQPVIGQRGTLLKLHNNLTQETEAFQPSQDMQVKMYTCGPSTYQRAHIGNYRTFLFEDILQRYLEYLNYKVTRLITLTNIEDKAIAQAQKECISVEKLTDRNETEFFNDFERLHIKRPDYTVRASTIVEQAAKLIKTLIDMGVAYNHAHLGAQNIYFDPTKFLGFGKLAHLDMKKWPKKKRRFHLDTYPGMPWNKGDFILWHGCKKGDNVCWETEIGRGRPAWNIQDAAMVTKHLGFSIDIGCGGIDNLVRHHDYTIAVAEAVSEKPFARYWLHGGHLYVDGKKMSKSKGNVLYPQDLTAKRYSNEQVRFFLIYGNYRKRRNFTWENLSGTSKLLDNCKAAVQNLQKAKAQSSSSKAKVLSHSLNSTFCKYMDNDLDVKGGFDELYHLVTALQELVFENKLSSEDAQAALTDLKEVDRVLQVIF